MMNPLFKITVCKFEDCHAGDHKKCSVSTTLERGVLTFCSCSCHQVLNRKAERREQRPS